MKSSLHKQIGRGRLPPTGKRRAQTDRDGILQERFQLWWCFRIRSRVSLSAVRLMRLPNSSRHVNANRASFLAAPSRS